MSIYVIFIVVYILLIYAYDTNYKVAKNDVLAILRLT